MESYVRGLVKSSHHGLEHSSRDKRQTSDIVHQCHLLSYSLEARVVGAVGDVEDGGHVPGGRSLHLFKQRLQVYSL